MRLDCPVKIPKQHNSMISRLVGIIHGDGNMSFKRVLITDECLEYHKNVIHPLFYQLFGVKLNLYHDKARNSFYSHTKNRILFKYLTKDLKLPNGAVRDRIRITKFMKQWPLELKVNYLAGIIDSEGYVSKRQAEIEISVTSKNVFDFVRTILNQLNIKYSIRIRKRNGRSKIDYSLNIYGKDKIKDLVKSVHIRHPEKIKKLEKFLTH